MAEGARALEGRIARNALGLRSSEGATGPTLSDEEEPEAEEVVEARPKKEMPCAKCGQRVVCVCESERYRVRKELRRKKLRPTRQKATARKHPTPADVDALVDLQQAEVARLAREEEQRKAYEAKFANKKKKGVLSLPHIVGAEEPPEDSLMKFFGLGRAANAGDQAYTLEDQGATESRGRRDGGNVGATQAATGEVELSVRGKMIYRTLTSSSSRSSRGRVRSTTMEGPRRSRGRDVRKHGARRRARGGALSLWRRTPSRVAHGDLLCLF